MSYKTVAGTSSTGGGVRAFTKFAVGESIEGHFVGLTPSRFSKPGAEKTDLNFQISPDVIVKVGRGGRLTYLEQDLEASGTALVIGAMTKLTRTGSYRAKGYEFDSPTYSLEQDTENVLDKIPELVEGVNTPEDIVNRIAELKEEAKA